MVTIRRKGKDGGPFRIVFGFDSISAFSWVSYPNGQTNALPTIAPTGSFADRVHTGLMAAVPGNPLVGFSSVGTGQQTVRSTSGLLWFNSGVAGDDCTNIVGNVATRVTQYAPDLVIIFLGVNCIQHAVSNATCLVNHASIIAQITAANPGVQIMVLDIMCIGENWPVGANANDTAIDAKIATAIAPTAVGPNVTYIPLRPAFFAYEAANNPSHLSILGPLTNSDASALHPSWNGCKFLGDLAYQGVQFAA